MHTTTFHPKILSNSNRNTIFTTNPKADDTLNTAKRRQKSAAQRFSMRLFQIQQYEQRKLLITAHSNEITGETTAVVRKRDKATTNNELIHALMQHCELTMFEEILPTMNEIFIETVGETNHTDLLS